MRGFTAALLGLAVALPLGVATVPAHADQDNGVWGRAQQFFQGNDNDAYRRGQEDQWRREHAQRDWRDHDRDQAWAQRDNGYDRGYRRDDQRWNNGYNNNYDNNGYHRDYGDRD